LQFKIGGVGWNGQNSHGVCVSKTTLPALYSDNGAASFDDVQLKTIAQSKPDTIVNLLKFAV
jgi:hypothetical protein